MKSFCIPRLILAFAAGLLISPARAISYREWSAKPSPQSAAVSIVLSAVSNGYVQESTPVNLTGQRALRNYTEVPCRPSGGYIGMVSVWPQGNKEIEYPLTLSFSYTEVVSDEDLLPASATNHLISAEENKDSGLKWQLPMGLLNPDSPVRAERYYQSIRIDDSSLLGQPAFPLILPGVAQMGSMRTDSYSSRLLSCLCEVKDARGNALARKQVIEVFGMGMYQYNRGTAWVMNEPEADRHLREDAGIEKSFTIFELPPPMEPYAEADALWVSAESARAGRPDRDLLRRLLLMGLWVYGRGETVSNLTAIAGLPAPGAVLIGGIQSPAKESFSKNHWNRGEGRGLWESFSYCRPEKGVTNAPPAMDNQRDLFKPYQGLFIGWTAGVLGAFFAVACAGLPLAFWTLKGSRRLVLWWLIPAVAVITGTAGLIIGRAILPRCAQSDVTEYRFAYAGWPEVYCQSVNRLLTFEDREAAWTLPADSFSFPTWTWRYRSTAAVRQRMIKEKDRVTHAIAGLKRGQIIIDETACFRPLPLPVEVDWAAGAPLLKSTAPLRRVHVWENGSWHRLGDLAPGQTASVLGKAITYEITGLPKRISACIPIYQPRSPGPPVPCKNCGKIHGRDNVVPTAFSNTWVVAALSDEPAGSRPEMKEVQGKSRTVWLIQIPLIPGAPEPGKNENKP